ncbi:hypothetical protein [Chitinophaga costaii]|nr:hypothetical protein [Chitinophaga costaii]
MAPLAVAMTENEMYDSTSLLMDELDDLFNACFQEEWDQHHLLQQLHRKLQSYLALQSTKMYGSVNAYIQHQSYAICAVELTAQEVANLW